ncbi:MAG TPA: sigma-70 family RNA polymerase sigma factor [Acidimicrobiales bacterium]|nr:sigma-70 family RNA polymerase sigma factor [Acidimicrobiales bacterium]
MLGLMLCSLGAYPLPDRDEQTALAERVVAGDVSAKHEMVVRNMRLVVYWARRMATDRAEIADLVQDGIDGLYRAVERFDPSRGFRFSTYATWWIRQSMQRAAPRISRTIYVPPATLERNASVERARYDLLHRLGRVPTVDEIAAEVGVRPGEVVDADDTPRVAASLDAPVGEGTACLADVVSRSESFTDDIDKQVAVRQAVRRLESPMREVIELRYGFYDGTAYSRDAVARRLHMRTRTIRLIEEEAISLLAGAELDALAG